MVFSGILAICWSCDTSSNVDPIFKNYYIKYFGGDGDNEGKDLIVNPDNTFVLLGSSVLQDGSRKIYVLKTDTQGNVLWEKQYGNGFEYPEDIEPTTSGYIILSNIDIGDGKHQFKLIRIDNDGNKVDSLVYDLLLDQFGQSITPLSDGGFYVVGNTSHSDSTNTNDNTLPVTEQEDILYVHFDNTFMKDNSTEDRVGSSSVGSTVKVFETAPGKFMTAEYSNQLDDDDSGVASDYENNFVFRNFTFDPTSTSQGLIILGDNTREEVLNQTVRSSDGNFYSIGTSTGTSSSSTIFITKTRTISSGPLKLFENSFSVGRMEGISIYPRGSSCYVLANIISDADFTRDIWLTKVNSFTGDQVPSWIDGMTIGTLANDDFGSVVAESLSGDILILGTMNLTNQKKIALIRLTSDGKFAP